MRQPAPAHVKQIYGEISNSSAVAQPSSTGTETPTTTRCGST